ncbi:MAG TPA: FtsX-like permease family protein [Vicinamibacteria bacterium]
MKYLPFIFKHLRRNWLRTGLTVAAMSLCIFLICSLQSVLSEIDKMLASSAANRLVTRNAVSLVMDLPLSYGQRIQAVPGVKRQAILTWFGGSLPAKKEGKATDDGDDVETAMDWSAFIPSMAVEAEPYFAMYPEFDVPPDQWRAFLGDMQGAVIGRKLADKYGWKVGDRFYLESFIAPYRKSDGPFEFVVRAIFDTDLNKYPGTDTNIMFFHFKYMYESLGRKLNAGTYTVEIDDADQAGVVSKAIDGIFENSDRRTHTETEKAFRAGFISMAGNLALLLNSIGLAVSFTILLVTANTMGMAVRERRTEIGVLKTLGFTSGKVMGLIVSEAVMLGFLGGVLGVGASLGAMWLLGVIPATRDALMGFGLSSLSLSWRVGALGFGAALLLGLGAGFVPAWNAYRSRITDALRTV